MPIISASTARHTLLGGISACRCRLIAEREGIVEVLRPIETRVGAPVAATFYVDNRSPPVIREAAPGIKAVRGEGRPRMRLRRELDRIRRSRRANRFESAPDG